MKIFVIWLIGVVIMELWIIQMQFQLEDVIAAILLSLFKYWIKKVFKMIINLLKNKYSENKL